MYSRIYQGRVQHSRFTPKFRSFNYSVYMVYLDLDEVDEVFEQSSWWRREGFAPVSFNALDYWDGETRDIKTAVQRKVAEDLGLELDGPVRMLTNLRNFGYINNPITCYYCFDRAERLQAVVAEVTNTPWGDRCHYAIAAADEGLTKSEFSKDMHVSPFMKMNMHYRWRSNKPGKALSIVLENIQAEERVFFASVVMQAQEMTVRNMRSVVLKFPWMTLSVITKIYWQALKIFCAGIKYQPRPVSAVTEHNKGEPSH